MQARSRKYDRLLASGANTSILFGKSSKKPASPRRRNFGGRRQQMG